MKSGNQFCLVLIYTATFDDIHPDINGIYAIILNEKPVAISKQDETKFKICYELDNDYDLTIIISIISHNSLTVNLEPVM